MTCRSWAGPRPSALLRAGVRLSRGPLRSRAAHRSRWSCPSHPSRIPPMLQLLSATTALRSGPPHFAPYANAAPRSSLLTSLLTQLAMAPVAAFGQPTLPKTLPTARFPMVSQPPLPTHHTTVRPRKAPKRPSRRPPAPPYAAAGHRLKNAGRLPLKSAFRPRRPNNKARSAEGFIGERPKPPPSCPG